MFYIKDKHNTVGRGKEGQRYDQKLMINDIAEDNNEVYVFMFLVVKEDEEFNTTRMKYQRTRLEVRKRRKWFHVLCECNRYKYIIFDALVRIQKHLI